MPRWARFLSCTVTGALLSLGGVLLAAAAAERPPEYWRALQAFAVTPAFLGLVLFFVLLAAGTVATARALAGLYGLPAAAAGVIGGTVLAACYMAVLVSAHLPAWGGWEGTLPRLWPSALWVAAPFAASGAAAGWLWERLD
mgnify:FL=1